MFATELFLTACKLKLLLFKFLFTTCIPFDKGSRFRINYSRKSDFIAPKDHSLDGHNTIYLKNIKQKHEFPFSLPNLVQKIIITHPFL